MTEKKTSAAQLRAAQKYKKENIKRITVEFSPAEAGLWEHIQGQPNKQGYIKGLIRADMESKAKHGRWIPALLYGKTYKDEDYGQVFDCSICGRSVIEDMNEYCPNCGTKMDGKEDE